MKHLAKIVLFDTYALSVPAGLICTQEQGRWSFTDEKRQFVILLEEGMPLLDMRPVEHSSEVPVRIFHYGKNEKYIQLRRQGNTADFHFELEDEQGSTLMLPGQMTVEPNYAWSDKIEPVLMAIMDGLRLL